MRTCCSASNSSTHLPAPMATEWSGLSVMWIGMPVSCFSRSSRPRSNAPPPVSTMPRSMTSPESSGGVLSRVVLTASTIWLTGSSIALRISSELTTMVFGRPVTRSRPRISACGSSGAGNADPIAILISSAVRSPSIRLYSFFTYAMIEPSSSSPPVRIDWLVTMPPREMTATSVVPPPMSTTMLPVGSCTGRGGGGAGADRRGHGLLDDVDLARARLVAGVLDRALLDAGDAGRHADDDARLGEVAAAVQLLDEVAEHPLGRLEVGDDAVLQRPDRHDVAGGAADHPLRLGADGEDPGGVGVDRDHARLVEHDALAADVDEGVGGAEVHGHVSTEERKIVRHEGARAFRSRGGRQPQMLAAASLSPK